MLELNINHPRQEKPTPDKMRAKPAHRPGTDKQSTFFLSHLRWDLAKLGNIYFRIMKESLSQAPQYFDD